MSIEPPADPTGSTRRAFLMTSGGAAAAIVGTSAMAQVDDGDPSSAPAEDANSSGIEGNVPITLRINGQSHCAEDRSADDASRLPSRNGRLDRHQEGLRPRPMRCLHGPCQWRARALVLEPRPGAGRQRDHDDRGPGHAGSDASHAGGVRRMRCVSVRLLHVRPNHVGRGAARGAMRAGRRRGQRAHERQHLPLRRVREHRGGHPTSA